jgi:hypothetical protein
MTLCCKRARLRSLKGSSGQALPVAIAALAVGALLVTPLLRGAGTSSRFTNLVGNRAHERYSMDAGVEWSGWRLISDPELTTDTSFSATPLAPLPASVNGNPFPLTEIRLVASAGAVEQQEPAWQGSGLQCYAFSTSDAGTASARISVDAGPLYATVLAAAAACALPGGWTPLPGGSPYQADLPLPAAGDYQLLVYAPSATSGSIDMTVPAATYEVRSVIGARNVIARLVAGYAGVRIDSWQLN